MASIYELTPHELEGLISFVRDGDDTVLETAAIEKFYNLNQMLGKKLADRIRKEKKRADHIQQRLDRYVSRENAAVERGDFPTLDLDSLEVAEALLYQLQQLKTYRLSRNKLVYILYGMYAAWLAGKKQRLFLEHPVATAWGPQFWRVYNKITNVTLRVPYGSWENITAKSTAVAGLIKTYAQKYYDISEKDLQNLFIKSEPYKNAVASKNGGKWNKEISDTDIYVWKTSKK